MSGLRLMTYDASDWDFDQGGLLTRSWYAGAILYKLCRAIDLVKPAKSWAEALQWVTHIEPDKKIDMWQFWGHGLPGAAYINGEAIKSSIFDENHPLHSYLIKLRNRLHPKSTVWFRTCLTFNGKQGKEFAKLLSNFLGCRVAAHTFLIGPFQSGLHTLVPGQEPCWPDNEGLDEKTGKRHMSYPWHPNTISCLRGSIPKGW